jgi:hypothetical protein
VRLLPDVRVLISGVIRSLPPLLSIGLLTTLILFVYGMVGWLLFGEEIPQDWGNIGTAMLTPFVMLTLENFPTYMERGMDVHQWSWIYFVSFVLIAAFIVLNVLIGIVLNSMEEAREIERRRRFGIGVEEAPSRHRAGAGPGARADAACRARRARGRARASFYSVSVASSAKRQTVLTRRICSTVFGVASSRRGLATT